jgi:crotonobetainyl-CoA:carnitine CoA-transferase CaiB-like acyl-CoA transferase
MAAIGRPDMGIDNPKYATDAKRWENEQDICDEIEKWVAGNEASEVMRVLDEARVPAGPILSIADIVADPQYQARGMFERVASPGAEGQELTVPAMAPVLHGTPGRTKNAGPELGQHTEEVLRDELGLEDVEMAKLREAGAI